MNELETPSDDMLKNLDLLLAYEALEEEDSWEKMTESSENTEEKE